MNIKRLATAVAVVMFGSVASATDYTWNGGASGAWNTASNWLVDDQTATAVPGSGDTAIFNAVAEVTDDIAIGEGTLTINRNFDYNSSTEASSLQLKGVISGNNITFTGGGMVRLYGENTFTGKLYVEGSSSKPKGSEAVVESGSVYAHHANALGAGSTHFVGTTGPRLYIANTVTHIATSIYFESNSGDNTGYIQTPSISTFTFDEDVITSAKCSIYAGSGRELHFLKDLDIKNYGFGSGTWHVHGKFCPSASLYNEIGFTALHLYSSGTGAALFQMRWPVYLHAENTMLEKSGYNIGFCNGKAIWHLNGFDQKITKSSYASSSDHTQGVLQQPSGVYTHGYESSEKAIVTMALKNNTSGEPITQPWWGLFSGKAGLCWNPEDSGSTFIFQTTPQTTEGELHVSNGTVRVTSGAGLASLSKLVVGPNGTFVLDSTASRTAAQQLILNKGKATIAAKAVLIAQSAVVLDGATETVLADGDYTAASGYFSGEGTLRVDSHQENTFSSTSASGDWDADDNWKLGHVPTAAESVVIPAGKTVSVSASNVRPYRIEIVNGATVKVTGWNTEFAADDMIIGGTLTLPEAAATLEASNRVHIVCNTLTIPSTGKINVNKLGWIGGVGYGARSLAYPTTGCVAGGAHGGYGALPVFGVDIVYVMYGGLYDDPYAPVFPGSGGCAYGTAGGGAVLIEATGKVTVNGQILANGESFGGIWNNFRNNTCGSGGSIWIKCAALEGSGGVIEANGGNADMICRPNWYAKSIYGSYSGYASSLGGGGMIRIEYTSAQQSATLENMVISADGGRAIGMANGHGGLTLATNDKYLTQADMGTLTFTDMTLVNQMLGKGLSGRLIDVNEYTVDGDMTWSNGHIRFAKAGARFEVTGDLTITGSDSRVEVGGTEVLTNVWVIAQCYGGTELNELIVGKNLTVTQGAALDIRAAETNATNQLRWGGEVKVGGNMTVGANAYVYPWCDVCTLGASHFEIGGNLDVQAGGTICADRRGGRGCWGSHGGAGTEKGYFRHNDDVVIGVGMGGGNNGASYGGRGGVCCSFVVDSDGNIVQGKTNGTVKAAFSDLYNPVFPGFGTHTAGYIMGNAGAGLIYITAGGSITLNGLITADAEPMINSSDGKSDKIESYQRAGAGSGGGIYLECETFTGTGKISARGGDGTVSDVAGSGTYAGKTIHYTGAGGGGGCVAIAVGTQCKVGRHKTHKAVNKADNAVINEKCTFTGSFDLSGGTNCWSSTDKKIAVPQYEATLGEVGTVRYIGFEPKVGGVIVFR